MGAANTSTNTRFVEVRHPVTNKLLFRFDPSRDLVEYGERGTKVLIDLTQYRNMDVPPGQEKSAR